MCKHQIRTSASETVDANGNKKWSIKLRCDICWVDRRVSEDEYYQLIADILDGKYLQTVDK